jgi:MFS superfamily sulfate permease-like transporter
MKKTRQLLILFVSMISTTIAHAQEKEDFEKFMRSEGRSYVVVAVMLTILTGLIIYLVRLDRKITRMEKEK